MQVLQINDIKSIHKLEQFAGQNICKVKMYRGNSYEFEGKYQKKDHWKT